MGTFDINEVIERYDLDIEALASILFPYVKYPDMALKRVLKGEACLDTKQLESLASYAGVLVQDLFTVDKWKGTTDKDGRLVMYKGEYRVVLNYQSTFMSMYHKGFVMAREVISGTMPITEFIKHIDYLINSYENGTD